MVSWQWMPPASTSRNGWSLLNGSSRLSPVAPLSTSTRLLSQYRHAALVPSPVPGSARAKHVL